MSSSLLLMILMLFWFAPPSFAHPLSMDLIFNWWICISIFDFYSFFFSYFINKTIIVLFYWYLCAFVAIRWKQYINNDINECEKKPTKLRLKYTVWHPVIRSSHTRSAHTIKKPQLKTHIECYILEREIDKIDTRGTRETRKKFIRWTYVRAFHTPVDTRLNYELCWSSS